MEYFVDLDINNKINGVKQVNDDYINPGNSIEIAGYEVRLMGTTYKSGIFEGYYITLSADKPQITANGVDTATITAKVFNYLDVAQNTFADIIFSCDGVQQMKPFVNGMATITITSTIAKAIDIKTLNTVDIIKNGEVIINAI